MKRIVLCGSRTFKDYIIQIGYKLEEEGYETIVKMGERIGECKKVKKHYVL